MIKIRLRKNENTINLAASMAEELVPLEIVPIIKNNEIVLDDSSSSRPLSVEEALQYVRRSLERLKTKYRYIYVKRETICVEDLEGEEKKYEPPLLFCPFCGYVTQYEEIYWIHVKSHGVI
ncbi:MAG: hypothetical protein QXF28_07820 [Nitrososphaerota archaeon]